MSNLPKKEQIRSAINDYCSAKGLSKNELATQIGVSGATLSKIENGKWDDIDDKLWRKIWNKVSDTNSYSIFKTADYSSCIKACKSAQNGRLMIGLIGDTGMGKTTALVSYSLKNKNVFYLVYDKTMAPKHFFTALLREMGIQFEGNIHQMVNRISDELNTISNPLLIIDESGKISHTMILYLHVLRDKTVKNCGIILSGMPYFKSNMAKFSNKGKEGYAEFNRRIQTWHELNGLSPEEIKFICESNSINDAATLKEMRGKKRFGDLNNQILLHQLLNDES